MNDHMVSKNEEILERLMNQYGNKILRLCFMYLKDYHLAEDALQETFIKVYEHLDGFRHEASESTWITRIAINTCKNMMRKPGYEDTYEDSWLEQIPEQNKMNHLIERISMISEIGKLSVKYREVILLYYYQEMSTTQIAQILHVPKTTVSCRLKNAKKRLNLNLKERCSYECN